MPDLVVAGAELRQVGLADPLEVRAELFALEAALGEVVADDMDLDALANEAADRFGDTRTVPLYARPERQWRHTLRLHRIVDCIGAQHAGLLGAGTLEGMDHPDDRIVLLLQRRAIGSLDDIERLHACLLTSSR